MKFDMRMRKNASRHSHGPRLIEYICMYVHHEVSTCRILHDKAHMFLGLKAGKEVDQERMADTVHRLEDPLLTHEAEGRKVDNHLNTTKNTTN